MALNKDGVRVTGTVGPHDFADDYATHDAIWGKDGLRSVADKAEMYAITRKRRRKGMLVSVPQLDENDDPVLNINGFQKFEIYQLVNNPSSGPTMADDWELFQTSGGGDKHYTHTQAIPSQEWTVAHNLDKKVAVLVEDVNEPGVVVLPAIEYIDVNTVKIHIGNYPLAGYAYCN